MRRTFILCIPALCSLLFSGARQQEAPEPRMPAVSTPADVSALLTGVEKVLTEFGIKADARVLVVTDRTVEPLVNEALLQGLQRLGARFEMVTLAGFPEIKTTLQQIKLWGLNWWPDWVWEVAAERYQYVVSPSYLVHIHTSKGKLRMMPWLRQANLKYLRVREPAAKLAYQPWMEYPRALEMAIIEKVLEQLPRRRTRVEVSDLEGTRFTYDDNWDWFHRAWQNGVRSINAGSLHVTGSPIQYLNANGVVVSSDTHLGPLPEPIRLQVEESRITRVEGGGEVGDYIRAELNRLQEKVFITTEGYGVPGPRALKGVAWLEEAAFMTHPKWIRIPSYTKPHDQDAFSTLFNKWLGMGRSGVFHTAVGMSESTAWGPAVMAPGERDWHIDFLNYFTTLKIGDELVIDQGRLTALDDPDIRALASRYGDPDQLLREDWIPRVPGVN